MQLDRVRRHFVRVGLASLLMACAVAQRPTYITVLGDGGCIAREGIKAAWPELLNPYQMNLPIAHNLAAEELSVADAWALLQAHAARKTVDVVVLQFGQSDARVDVDDGARTPRLARTEFARHLRELVQQARGLRMAGTATGEVSDIQVVLMTPVPQRWTPELRVRLGRAPYDAADSLGFDHLLATYAAEVRSLAEELQVPLVDVHRIFSRRDRFKGHSTTDWMLDGMHPNDEGQRVLRDLVSAAITYRMNFYVGADPTRIPDSKNPRTWQGRPDYLLPILDLSCERWRQTIVDREAGQYLGHPTTVLLEDGSTLLAVYPKGHGSGAIVYKRSSDGGRTWSPRLPTPESWATSKEVPTIHRVVDAQGARRLILFSGLYPIRMAVSEDDGASWSELKPIGDYGGIVAMGCVIPTKAPGRYLALFHDDGRFFSGVGQVEYVRPGGPQRFKLFQVESTDGGLTWGAPRVILNGSPLHCEPGFVRSPDGETVAVLLRENSRLHNSHVMFSSDEGATWDSPRPLTASLTGDRHIARYAPDGRLFITFRDRTRVSPTWGDWVAWVGTWEDLYEHKEGQYRVRLMDNTKGADCAYPGLELLPDGTFVTTTYGHWTRGASPYVVSVRLSLDELDALAQDPTELR